MKPWEKEIVEQGKVNVEDREAWRGAGVVLNGVVRIVLTGEVRLSPFTPRGSQRADIQDKIVSGSRNRRAKSQDAGEHLGHLRNQEETDTGTRKKSRKDQKSGRQSNHVNSLSHIRF